VSSIRQATVQMSELMNGLLILARADEDVTLDLHAIDVAACVEGVVATCRRVL
jgi:signal transduction histidine kinase